MEVILICHHADIVQVHIQAARVRADRLLLVRFHVRAVHIQAGHIRAGHIQTVIVRIVIVRRVLMMIGMTEILRDIVTTTIMIHRAQVGSL